jgi:hypothetical protein
MYALAVTAAVQNARDASCYNTSSECGRFSHERTKKTQVSKDMTTPIVSWPFWPASVLNLAIFLYHFHARPFSLGYLAVTDLQIKIANLTKSWATELLHSVIPSLNDNMFCFLY